MDKWGIIGQEEDRRPVEDKLITNPNKAGRASSFRCANSILPTLPPRKCKEPTESPPVARLTPPLS